MVEELEEEFSGQVPESGGEPVLYQDIKETTSQRIPVGIDQFNNVLGGGLVLGSVVLIGGEPGSVNRPAASGLQRIGHGGRSGALCFWRRVAGTDQAAGRPAGFEPRESLSAG